MYKTRKKKVLSNHDFYLSLIINISLIIIYLFIYLFIYLLLASNNITSFEKLISIIHTNINFITLFQSLLFKKCLSHILLFQHALCGISTDAFLFTSTMQKRKICT